MIKQDEFIIIKKALYQLGLENSRIEAELNPDNQSQFEKELSSIVDDVDIMKGTEGLDRMPATSGDFIREDETISIDEILVQNVDIQTVSEETLLTPSISDETKIAGIDFVRSRVEHYLVKSGLTQNILVEYSLLSSTLEPTNPDKLQCISFALGEEDFKRRINTYYTECIRQTNLRGPSVYQHSRFLYNIDLNDKPFGNMTSDDDTKTCDWADCIGVTGTFKRNENDRGSVDNYKIFTDKNNNPDYKAGTYKKIGSGSDEMYVDAFKLNRSFNEMLNEAKKNDESCDTSQKRLVDIQNILHSFCHRNISRERGRDSVYISFPIYGSRASNQLPQYEIIRKKDKKRALQGIGAFFIYFEPEIDLETKSFQKLIEFIMTKIAYEMGNFIRLISANYMFNLGLQLQEKARKEAIKSAKAAIMSRNMSHNLGSHVMSYLKQSLSSVNNIFRDKILSLLIQDVNNLAIDQEIKEAKEKGDEGVLPFLVGLGQFISYIQERQDFIATIATDYIPYLSTVNFKDFIYDELNPDKRYERHKTRQRLKIDNILLGNIARSEGLGRTTSPTNEQALSDIILKFCDFDGDPVEQQDEKGHPLGTAIKGREKEFATLKDMRAYNFSLPGGVVGRQAVFSIVENVVRNAAKHGNWRNKGELVLEFNIFTKQFIENTPLGNQYLDDNEGIEQLSLRQVFKNFYLPACDSKDLYFITLTDNLSMDEDKLEKLRKVIKEPLINERGEMNEAGKGIKEMRISSTWIRSLDEGETYNPIKYADDGEALTPENRWESVGEKQFAPALYARISNGHLQYIFCVLRPKEIAIISTQFAKDGDENVLDTRIFNEDVFQKNSWAAFTPKQYYEERNKSYGFVIFDDINGVSNEKEYQYEALRNISSTRFWKLSNILKDIDPQNMSNVYDEFFKRIKSMSNDDINYIQTSLYRKLSDFNEGEIIYIDDKTASANDELRIKESEKENNPYKTSDYVKVDDGIEGKGERLYIYRSHHDTEDRYKEFVKSVNVGDYQGNIFVEGITGNNSTDRLVRNEKLDDVWFYKHLHAMKENVAIFDERLFSKIIGLEEAQLKDDGTFRIDDSNRDMYRDRYYKEILHKDWKEYKKFSDLHSSEQDKKLEDSFKDEKGTISSIEAADIKGVLPIVFKQKGIYLFTLIQEPNPDKRKSFNLYGLKIENELMNCKCIKLSTLSWDGAELHFSGDIINDSANSYKKFERISIHQGLLDKLYEVFKIKDKPEEKKKLTTKFHETFSSILDVEEQVNESTKAEKDTKIEIETKDFLPGLCIHSGRSKPSKTDMPQQLPFIQYAAIENAVLDCKYSLVELLDFARYE